MTPLASTTPLRHPATDQHLRPLGSFAFSSGLESYKTHDGHAFSSTEAEEEYLAEPEEEGGGGGDANSTTHGSSSDVQESEGSDSDKDSDGDSSSSD